MHSTASPAGIHAGQADRDFVEHVIHEIPGWLDDYVALRIMELMRRQSIQGLAGPVLEIGVYAGRCFAVLLREAQEAGDLAVGLDTFHRISEVEVRSYLNIAPDAAHVRFAHGRSLDYDRDRLLGVLGAPARFISIDGSHMLEDVRHDLTICAGVLSDSGVIACDDFLNPVRMGVCQAMNEYLAEGVGLVPFAYIRNKLFLCRRSFHAEWLSTMLEFCVADARGPGEVFGSNALANNGRNQTELYGWLLVTLP